MGSAVVLLLVGWVALAAVRAAQHLQAVRTSVQDLSLDDSPDTLRRAVAQGRADADDANGWMRQPGPALAARLPWVGSSLAAERDVSLAASAGLGAADRVLALTDRLRGPGGDVDLAVLDRIAGELQAGGEQLGPPLARLDDARLHLAPAALVDAVGQVRDRLVGVDATLRDAAPAVRAVGGLLGADGPRTIVLALMNNAELRGAGGYASSIAVLRTDAGRLEIGPLQDTNTFDDPPDRARAVPAPDDYSRRWGTFLANTTLWKNVLMSADGPSSAPVLCRVARLAPGVPCDGVVLLDIPTLAALTTLSGPVALPDGSRAGGEDLIRALLVDAYAEVGDGEGAQQARRLAFAAAADRALADLLSGDNALGPVKVLAGAALGRHVVLWSDRPDEERDLQAVGVGGSVDPEGADVNLVSFNQFSIGKLDYYVSRDVTVDAVVNRDTAEVTQTVALSVDAPPGLSTYVTGLYDAHLRGLLDIGVAPDATVETVLLDGAPVEHGLDAEDGTKRVTVIPDVPNGSTATYTVRYTVPVTSGTYRLKLFPQPLVRDASLRVSLSAAPGLSLVDGPVQSTGPYDRVRTFDVVAR